MIHGIPGGGLGWGASYYKKEGDSLKKEVGGGVGGEEIGQKKIKGNKKLCNLELSNI